MRPDRDVAAPVKSSRWNRIKTGTIRHGPVNGLFNACC
ncbi:hypothetical protein V1289_006587 [Bradyrhizobium sp. AZCC 2289]